MRNKEDGYPQTTGAHMRFAEDSDRLYIRQSRILNGSAARRLLVPGPRDDDNPFSIKIDFALLQNFALALFLNAFCHFTFTNSSYRNENLPTDPPIALLDPPRDPGS